VDSITDHNKWYVIAEANDDAEEGRGLFALPFMRRAAEQQRAAAAADAASLLHSIEAEASPSLLAVHQAAHCAA
jgi:hypothetical protein